MCTPKKKSLKNLMNGMRMKNMSKYFSDGEYWTRHGRIQHTKDGKYIESVKKLTNIVSKSELSYHAYRKQTGTA